VLYVITGLLLLQLAIGGLFYIHAWNASKRTIIDFSMQARHLDARCEALGLALYDLLRKSEARFEALGFALGDLLNKSEARSEAFGLALGDLINKSEARFEALGTEIGHLRHRAEIIRDDLVRIGSKANQLQKQLTVTNFALGKISSPADIFLDDLDQNSCSGFRDVSRKRKLSFRLNNDRSRTAVVVVLGQSNAANHGEGQYASSEGVYNFNVYDGCCYHAVDPLLGATGSGGNFATRFGDIIKRRKLFDQVIIAPIATAGSTVEDWANGGKLNRLILLLIRRLCDAALAPDFILWQQGIGNIGTEDFGGRRYKKNLLEVVRTFRSFGINAPFVVALESGSVVGDIGAKNIRSGQYATVNGEIGTILGPDIDSIGKEHRSDGCHFKESGLQVAATMWADALGRVPAR
jgi:Carbohydrate esterase, sialic acid-specific acetylesterase